MECSYESLALSNFLIWDYAAAAANISYAMQTRQTVILG